MRRILFLIVATLTAAVLLAGFGVYAWLMRSVPVQEGTHTVRVDGHVHIHFDHRGRPFIQAESWQDAFFAQGFVHARDRLWQMELLRRAGRGQLAAFLGESMLPTDIELTQAGVPELARRLQNNASDELAAWVNAYAEGANAFLALNHPMAPEMSIAGASAFLQPWEPLDVYAMGALMAWQSARNGTNELLRLALLGQLEHQRFQVFLPEAEAQPNPLAIDPAMLETERLVQLIEQTQQGIAALNALVAGPSLGSNSWAADATRSASGHALLAFDSHDAFSMPNLTYDVHMFVGQEQIRGASVPGLLGVINGYNEFMAWGFTNIGDSQDLFVETLRDGKLKDGDAWYAPRIQQVSIGIAGRPDHVLDIRHSKNGRLISMDPPVSRRWAALEDVSAGMDALIALNRATSYEAFDRAMDEFAAPSANVTYADIRGHVEVRTIGVLPSRGSGNGTLPLSGSNPNDRWQGILGAGGLPRINKPFVYSANRPLAITPLVSADNAPGYRVARIDELARKTPAFDVEHFKEMQTDMRNLQAQRVLPLMLRALEEEPLNDLEAAVVEVLERWLENPDDRVDLAGPLIFETWYIAYLEAQFKAALGDGLYRRFLGARYVVNDTVDNRLLPSIVESGGETHGWQVAKAVRAGFKEAVNQLVSEYGEQLSNWQWGSAHTLAMRHEMSGAFPGASFIFDRVGKPVGGGNMTLGRARFSYARPFEASGGATVRQVVELSDPPVAWSIMPGGQSGHPLDEHYNDQTEQWLSGGLDRIAQTPDDAGPVSIRLIPEAETTN